MMWIVDDGLDGDGHSVSTRQDLPPSDGPNECICIPYRLSVAGLGCGSLNIIKTGEMINT